MSDCLLCGSRARDCSLCFPFTLARNVSQQRAQCMEDLRLAAAVERVMRDRILAAYARAVAARAGSASGGGRP